MEQNQEAGLSGPKVLDFHKAVAKLDEEIIVCEVCLDPATIDLARKEGWLFRTERIKKNRLFPFQKRARRVYLCPKCTKEMNDGD